MNNINDILFGEEYVIVDVKDDEECELCGDPATICIANEYKRIPFVTFMLKKLLKN